MPAAPSDGYEGRVTCVVADDHPAVLEAVCTILEAGGIEVTGRARDGLGAAEEIEYAQPRVALLDVQMPGLSGIDVVRRVARSAPRTGIVLYTAFGERSLVLESLDAGARGFVLKEAPLPDLVRAVETVARGGRYLDPVPAGMIAGAGAPPGLTQREREILRLLADGRTNEEIGRQLSISAETVRTHVRNAMAKLDAGTRTQAVASALRRSLIA
jgi:DNA-binding NarL/FixJ family response regulator